MKRRFAIAVALLAAVSTTAVVLALSSGGASAATGRDTYSNCLRHAQSTFDMDQCVATELRRLRPLLASAYSKLLHDPDSTAHQRSELRVAQRAWQTYTAKDCRYAGSFYKGGTLQPVIESECKVTRERRRLSDLRAYAVPIGH